MAQNRSPRLATGLLLCLIGMLLAACGSQATTSDAEAIGSDEAPISDNGADDDAEESSVAEQEPDDPAPEREPAAPTAPPASSAASETEDADSTSTTDNTNDDVAELVTIGRPPAPSGRQAPDVAASAAELATQVAAAEAGLADPTSTDTEKADWGHLHQVAIRKLGYTPAWDSSFFEALPSDLQARTLLHVSARRALIDLSSGYDAADFIPAWQIVNPEPADALVSYYQEAEAATGIEWEFLAAINLVETGMGRIRGLSSAGAQGPMQFLPTTWTEAGIGEGDINDPRDAINAAARYLVRRGGPSDMQGAIWGYNNSDDYVTAVRAYAALLRQDPAAYSAIYNWEIYFFTEAGDIWLPAGFRSEESVDLYEFLEANPWSAPDPGLR